MLVKQRCLKGDTKFCIKPEMTSNKNIDLNSYNCESCLSTLVDLIKCNLCSKYVCESCNEIAVSKLKTLFPHNAMRLRPVEKKQIPTKIMLRNPIPYQRYYHNKVQTNRTKN